jgi:hypothetical protein
MGRRDGETGRKRGCKEEKKERETENNGALF